MQRADDAAGAGGAQLLLRRTLHLSAVSAQGAVSLDLSEAAFSCAAEGGTAQAGAVQAGAENARGLVGLDMCDDARPARSCLSRLYFC